jgi:excisionase family DNA binding protein
MGKQKLPARQSGTDDAHLKEAKSVTRRRVEITFERERLLLVGRRSVSVSDWCGCCGARVRMVMPDEAARLTGVTARTVCRLVEAGRLHFLKGSEAGLLVCLASLKELSQNSADAVSEE